MCCQRLGAPVTNSSHADAALFVRMLQMFCVGIFILFCDIVCVPTIFPPVLRSLCKKNGAHGMHPLRRQQIGLYLCV